MGQSGNDQFALFNAESKYPSLESLTLVLNDTIVMLWSPACYVYGFQNLKALDIVMCRELRSLGSPSIFAALVQLEELEISNCHRLQEIIGKETEGDEILEKEINFPKLKHVNLDKCNTLERFYGGSCNLKFPNLESLRLSTIANFTNFDGSENSTTLFSDKIEFAVLEELVVNSLSNQVLKLWNWSSSPVDLEGESGSISFNPVPNLQRLRLGNVSLNHGLMSIPNSVSQKLSHLDVNKFDNIKSLFSVSAVNGEAFCTYSQFTFLKKLSVHECESLEELVDSEGDEVAVSLCECLVDITLKSLPKMKILSLHLLKNIHTLSLSKLSWKYVFSADLLTKGKEQLQRLESLEITDCKNMEVIIEDEVVGDVGEENVVYSFPSLKILKLESSDITKFASKPNTGIQFPSLERIVMWNCNNIESFWSGSFIAPKLKVVKLSSSANLQCFLSKKRNQVQELPLLDTVEISQCLRLLSFSKEPLVAPKLHRVTLDNCPEMKWFLRGDPNNNDVVELPSLEIVSIAHCDAMKSLSTGGIEAPKLCELEVNSKDFSKGTNEELQYLLSDLPKRPIYIREDSDDSD